jgi:hypothetical protein
MCVCVCVACLVGYRRLASLHVPFRKAKANGATGAVVAVEGGLLDVAHSHLERLLPSQSQSRDSEGSRHRAVRRDQYPATACRPWLATLSAALALAAPTQTRDQRHNDVSAMTYCEY